MQFRSRAGRAGPRAGAIAPISGLRPARTTPQVIRVIGVSDHYSQRLPAAGRWSSRGKARLTNDRHPSNLTSSDADNRVTLNQGNITPARRCPLRKQGVLEMSARDPSNALRKLTPEVIG